MRRRLAVGVIALTLVQAAPATSTATADVVVKKPAAKVTPPAARSIDSSEAEVKSLQALARRIASAAVAKDATAAAKLKARQAALAKAKRRAAAAAAVRARASRAAARKALYTPSYVWAHRPFSIRVANCESGGGPTDHSVTYEGNAHLNDPNGHYGKWQFDYSTWRDVGGSGNPARASVVEQDLRAYRLWQQRGWQPWQCARMVG